MPRDEEVDEHGHGLVVAQVRASELRSDGPFLGAAAGSPGAGGASSESRGSTRDEALDAEAPTPELADADREQWPFLPRDGRDVVALLPEETSRSVLLQRLASRPLRLRGDLVGGANRQGGSGGQLGIFLELGAEFLKTAQDRRYRDVDVALECEWAAEVQRQGLGIYHPERVWFLSRGGDGGFWSCSLTPTLASLRDRFNEPGARGPDRTAWELYLAAFRVTFRLSCQEGLLLDCNPNNFGVEDSQVYYVDDDIARWNGRLPFGYQALLRLREYASADLSERSFFLREFARLALEWAGGAPRLREQLLEDLETGMTWPVEAELRQELTALVAGLRRLRRGRR